MAKSFDCKCPERQKPVKKRNWLVLEYKWNSGAFVKKGGEPSDYSSVICKACGASGRTKAKYVGELPRYSKPSDLENINII